MAAAGSWLRAVAHVADYDQHPSEGIADSPKLRRGLFGDEDDPFCSER